nr:unnamed protein product [Callosobruchus analis]
MEGSEIADNVYKFLSCRSTDLKKEMMGVLTFHLILRHTGYTALHYAARNGQLDVCKLLIDNGANINAVCSNPTPMVYRR